MSERVLKFEAIENVRDYGDYATAAGRRLARGRLIRTAHHARATDADLARLTELGVSVVVDLRHPDERRKQPSRRAGAFRGTIVESELDDGEREAPHVTFLRTSDLTEESARGYMTAAYKRIPFEPRHLDLFSRYFQALAETDGAVVIHCAAGKDRTGVLAALTHHVAGVSDSDAIEDYLLTNRAVDLQGRAPAIAAQIEREFGRKASHEAVVAFLGVEETFLQAAFAEIRARYGSLDGYLEQALGVDAALRERIEARLCA